MKKIILGREVDMSDTFAWVEAEIERVEMQEYTLDFIGTYNNEEIATLVREKILTIEEVEAGLRRSMA